MLLTKFGKCLRFSWFDQKSISQSSPWCYVSPVILVSSSLKLLRFQLLSLWYRAQRRTASCYTPKALKSAWCVWLSTLRVLCKLSRMIRRCISAGPVHIRRSAGAKKEWQIYQTVCGKDDISKVCHKRVIYIYTHLYIIYIIYCLKEEGRLHVAGDGFMLF